MVGVYVLVKVPVNQVTCIFASILVGLAGDNVIQFLFAGQRGAAETAVLNGVSRRGPASLQISLTMAAAVGLYGFSAFSAPRLLGALLCCGLFLSVAGDVWLLKALLAWPRHALVPPQTKAALEAAALAAVGATARE
jgi:predicted RND superfamily exporter protein